MRPFSAVAWRVTRRWLYFLHRWTGIALCVLFAIWFVSGVVMMYVPFPSFRAEERMSAAAPIRWDLVQVGPQAALVRLGGKDFPEEMRLEMTGGEPVYRMTYPKGRRAVSALTGDEITGVDNRRAMRIAEAMLHVPAASATTVEHDQWVVTRAYARIAPFWRVRMADPARTDIYITQHTGEIVQNTDGWERFWNWLGAVPHWIYFEVLRVYQEPWRQTVIWTSGIGIVGAILGIWIGILRLRVSRRYASGSVSPYRGWMKWHHVTGLVGGLVLVTWVFSGWMSMSPLGSLGEGSGDIAERYAGKAQKNFVPVALVQLAPPAETVLEARFLYVDSRPTVLLLGPNGKQRAFDAGSGAPIPASQQAIADRARRAVPGARLVAIERLTKPDLYWYSTGDPRRDGRPLPVLRLRFDDPKQSWLYVDPDTGLLLAQSNAGRRANRWLFNALHSFDLPLLLQYRPLRDGLMILLSLAGLIISVSGIVVGWRYLRRPKPSRARAAVSR